ncbi:MAG: maleylpyruvate isomerase family mycothiol-dependent enzyme [Acidimicrobiia bacterium]|nr:maleylpyruvate isomerase family mycothiol-dependent enzyme [Acidimicrobiia bacterium]
MTDRFGMHPEVLGTEAIARFTRHLVELADPERLDRPVETCGDWTMADLIWHLTEVQSFWAWIIENRPAPVEAAVMPDRAVPAALRAQLIDANDRLCGALDKAPFDDPTWTWHPEHKTVDFSIRRQTHEALIHCFDAVLATGGPAPDVGSLLAADGFDELVTVMAGGVPEWADHKPGDRLLGVHAVDTGDRWLLDFGTISGRSPRGTDYIDEPTIVVVDPESSPTPSAELSGPALDLNLWAWGRGPIDGLTIHGDDDLVASLRTLIIDSTQ